MGSLVVNLQPRIGQRPELRDRLEDMTSKDTGETVGTSNITKTVAIAEIRGF